MLKTHIETNARRGYRFNIVKLQLSAWLQIQLLICLVERLVKMCTYYKR